MEKRELFKNKKKTNQAKEKFSNEINYIKETDFNKDYKEKNKKRKNKNKISNKDKNYDYFGYELGTMEESDYKGSKRKNNKLDKFNPKEFFDYGLDNREDHNYEGKKELDYFKNIRNKRLVHNDVVKDIILDGNIIFDNYLMKYDEKNGYFKRLNNQMASTHIYSKIPESKLEIITDYHIKSILNLLKIHPNIQIYEENKKSNKKLINCKNCVLKINKNNNIEIKEHSKKYLFLNVVNANYLEEYDFKNSKFREFIESLTSGDKELIRLIRQVLGYCVSNFNNAKKAFIFYGKSNTGKSVLLNLLLNICGEDNVSNIELQNLNRRENIANLYGKKLNVCNELPDYKMTDTGIFKALVSDNDKVTGKALYSNPFSFYNKAKLVFACNNLPSINLNKNLDYSAFFNRLVIIPCLNSIPIPKQDRDLFKKLLKEKDLIFSWAIGGLQEYIDNDNKFIAPKASRKIMKEYISSINVVDSFINECCEYNENEYSFKYEIEEYFIKYYFEKKGVMPKDIELKELIEKIKEKYLYKRINRNGENKYGFLNLKVFY